MRQYKIAFQDPDTGLYEINHLGSNEPTKKLSFDDFTKLQSLMPSIDWIVIEWTKPENKNSNNGNT